ncbi:hypothetical protein O3P69_013631 [Scylla paramamosain]|uniref:Uncharacterized protein n=1 Tax=Scylla paramamosain TaxID=85552 RepID=A0AAW0SPS7_SCYPA
MEENEESEEEEEEDTSKKERKEDEKDTDKKVMVAVVMEKTRMMAGTIGPEHSRDIDVRGDTAADNGGGTGEEAGEWRGEGDTWINEEEQSGARQPPPNTPTTTTTTTNINIPITWQHNSNIGAIKKAGG